MLEEVSEQFYKEAQKLLDDSMKKFLKFAQDHTNKCETEEEKIEIFSCVQGSLLSISNNIYKLLLQISKDHCIDSVPLMIALYQMQTGEVSVKFTTTNDETKH